jgi:hypothetical protein
MTLEIPIPSSIEGQLKAEWGADFERHALKRSPSRVILCKRSRRTRRVQGRGAHKGRLIID